MWGSGRCWSCTVRLVAEYIRGPWRSIPADAHRCGTSMEQGMENENAGARRVPSARRAEDGQRILGVVATPHSVVIVAYPKITEGPPLVKRKLGSNHWDLIHEGIQGRKRDGTICATDQSLCPQSLGGGCCPTDRVCGLSSCYPSSATTASACGQAGYYGCGVEEGGGCCPTSYICGVGNCTPSPGVSYSQTCGANSYLCAASFGYGCCKSGRSCWYNSCYATSSVTFTVTETVTTTDANANPYTITTTITTATNPELPTDTPPTDGIISQVTPLDSAVPKSAASGGSSSGLTKPEIGGIIGGAIFILLALLVATFLILHRLSKAIEATQKANSGTSSSGHRSRRSGQRPIDVDALSVDPLMMTPSEAGGSIRRPSQFANSTTQIHEMETNSPPVFNSPFSPRTPPYTHYPKGYKPVSTTSESRYSSSTRHGSIELPTPPLQHNPNTGYFDLPPQSARNRGSADSTPSAMTRRPSHSRQWSNSSDQSQVSQASNSSNPTELDAGKDGVKATPRRSSGSSFTKALHELGVGMTRMVSFRRRSDPPVLTGGPVRNEKPDWMTNTAYNGAGQALGHIPEAGESRINLEGEGGISNAQMREATLKDSQSPIVKEGTKVFSQEITGGEVPEFLMGNEPGR